MLTRSTHVGNTEILHLLKLGIEIAHIRFLSNNFEVTLFTFTSLPSGLARMKLRGVRKRARGSFPGTLCFQASEGLFGKSRASCSQNAQDQGGS